MCFKGKTKKILMENKALHPLSKTDFLKPGENFDPGKKFTKDLETFISHAIAKFPILQVALLQPTESTSSRCLQARYSQEIRDLGLFTSCLVSPGGRSWNGSEWVRAAEKEEELQKSPKSTF